MATKETTQPFLNWGQERTEAAMALQKDLLASYEEASRAWLARVQSEVALWSDLASRSVGNVFEMRFGADENGRRRRS